MGLRRAERLLEQLRRHVVGPRAPGGDRRREQRRHPVPERWPHAAADAALVGVRHCERQAERRRRIAAGEQQPGTRRRLVRALPPAVRFGIAGRRSGRTPLQGRRGELAVAAPQRGIEVEHGKDRPRLVVFLAGQPRQVTGALRVSLGEHRAAPGQREQDRDIRFAGKRADRGRAGVVKQLLREEQVVAFDGHLRRRDRRQAPRRGIRGNRVAQPARQCRRRRKVAAQRGRQGQPAAGPQRQGAGSRGRQLMMRRRQRARAVGNLPAAQQHGAER